MLFIAWRVVGGGGEFGPFTMVHTSFELRESYGLERDLGEEKRVWSGGKRWARCSLLSA